MKMEEIVNYCKQYGFIFHNIFLLKNHLYYH